MRTSSLGYITCDFFFFLNPVMDPLLLSFRRFLYCTCSMFKHKSPIGVAMHPDAIVLVLRCDLADSTTHNDNSMKYKINTLVLLERRGGHPSL